MMQIRAEAPGDVALIARLTEAAFREAPHRSGREAEIIAALRSAGALGLSLLACDSSGPVGHIAASPCRIGTGTGTEQDFTDGFGDCALIAPVSVLPARQGQGIGQALMRALLAELTRQGVSGAALVGDPAYYGRFGFRARPGLSCAGIPDMFVQSLSLSEAPAPAGVLILHPAFLTA